MSNIKDLIIIGGGPAGLNAALYASRANVDVVFVEKGAPGGKLSSTWKIENWLGTVLTEGWELATQFYNHAIKYGATHKYGKVESVQKNDQNNLFEVFLENGEKLLSKTVLVSTGTENRKPTFIENFMQFENRGVSYCAICDGPLFAKQPTIVLGGGNSAVEESAYLSKIASQVYLVVKDEEFTAEKSLVEELQKLENVKVFFSSQITKLEGSDSLEAAYVKLADGSEIKLDVASFFPYIGMIPQTNFVKDLGVTNDHGYILVNDKMETSVKGLYAAGDVIDKKVRQIVTAAGDGATAAKSISDYLNTLN
ncbi:NAD(P)/FAD-dependent oxidoreductase [Mycoplasma sp. Ms02]|uniref:NAD(P)/FAD-dependent oxidoreductase n=1 Tax=Mycoplasma sp. Ms02 TaxID=353851 RepID=UPI001C8A7DE2|nr:FAD-dependent oxidoreductase [Mycoplasma sp. Ms02]QZE12083.1 FAD-dependent oxidoreductase [Mycoplasma sp. Ms02]